MLSKKSGLHNEGSQPMPECNHVRPWSLPVRRQPSPAGHVTAYSGAFHGTMPVTCLLLDMRSAASHAAATVSAIHHPSRIMHRVQPQHHVATGVNAAACLVLPENNLAGQKRGRYTAARRCQQTRRLLLVDMREVAGAWCRRGRCCCCWGCR